MADKQRFGNGDRSPSGNVSDKTSSAYRKGPNAQDNLMDSKNSGQKVGRPKKADLAQTKDMTKREQSAALREYRQRLLLNPKSPKLIEKLFDTAFDDDHKNQAVAMKLLADRLMPLAGFTADGKQQASVNINITGLSSGSTDTGVIIDGESGEIDDE